MGELSDAEAERLLEAFRAAGIGPAAVPTPDRQSGVGAGDRCPTPGPAALPSTGISAIAGSSPQMSYSAGWDGAGDATDGAHTPAGINGPAAPEGAWQPGEHAASGDTGGGTTVSSVDFLADLGSSAEARAVAKVLSAAAAPPWPHELRGYESARRAFENAGATPVRRSAGIQFRRLAGVKLAAVAGALTVTGVAVAAEADVLPSPIQRAAHQMLGGVGVPDPDSARPGQTMASSPGSPTGHPGSQGPQGSQSADPASGEPSDSGALLPGTPSSTADTPDTPGSTASSADADVLALCRTYVAHKGNGNGNGNGNSGLSEKDRKRLATLAGSKNKIDDYCTAMLAAPSAGSTVPQPSGVSTAAAPGTSTTPPTPSPTHDHKPNSTTSSGPAFAPATSAADENGSTPTPTPTHTGHKKASSPF